MTENCIYIKDGTLPGGYKINFAALILEGLKTYETRTHKALTRKWVGVARNGFVIGRIKLGEPVKAGRGSNEYKESYINMTEYDIQPGETKYFYPVIAAVKFNKPKPIIRHGNYGLYELDNR